MHTLPISLQSAKAESYCDHTDEKKKAEGLIGKLQRRVEHTQKEAQELVSGDITVVELPSGGSVELL